MIVTNNELKNACKEAVHNACESPEDLYSLAVELLEIIVSERSDGVLHECVQDVRGYLMKDIILEFENE